MNILAIDVGSASVRAVVYGDDGARLAGQAVALTVRAPDPGTVEFDGEMLARSVMAMAPTASPLIILGSHCWR